MHLDKSPFFRIVLCVLAASLAGGCSSLGSPVALNSKTTIYDRKGIDVIIEPTTGSSYLLTDEKIRDQFCMAPPPDLSDAKSTSGGLSVKGISLSEGTALSVAALGGRSPAVLISREIMYRTCELYVNGRMTKEESIAIFKASLDRVVEVTKAQIAQGTTTQISGTVGNNAGSSGNAGDGSGMPAGSAGDGSGMPAGSAGDGSGMPAGSAGDGSGMPAGNAGDGSGMPAGVPRN